MPTYRLKKLDLKKRFGNPSTSKQRQPQPSQQLLPAQYKPDAAQLHINRTHTESFSKPNSVTMQPSRRNKQHSDHNRDLFDSHRRQARRANHKRELESYIPMKASFPSNHGQPQALDLHRVGLLSSLSLNVCACASNSRPAILDHEHCKKNNVES